MKKRTVVLLSITAIGLLLLSGCTNQTSNNTDQQQTISDEFTTNVTGGTYDLAEGRIHVDIPEHAVSQQVTITVDSIPDPPYDTDVVLAHCYSFGPNGTTFATPINLTLRYDTSIITADIPVDILHLFVLSGTVWSKVQNCVTDTVAHTVTGGITHFSLIGLGYVPSEKLTHSTEHNDSEHNTSASITFEVPVQLYQYETNNTPWPSYPDQIDYTYYCGGYIAWDPSPYVRYYELNIHYNGNTKPSQKIWTTCDYQEWGKPWCPLDTYKWDETTTKYLGKWPVPDERNFLTIYDNSPDICGADKHGMTLANMYASFDHTDGLTREQISAIEKEMYDFVTSYLQGWTFTIKNVS
jgi:hypothetical protein